MKILMSSVALAAMAMGVSAQAQTTQTNASQATEDTAGEVVVTGRPVARANTVVARSRIDAMPGAQNIIDSIKLVAGVSIRGADSSNSDPWSYGINIRGFDVNLRSSKIGQTVDDMPAYNASYYLGGAPAQKYLMNETVSSIVVNQGTSGVSSASSSALGGTLAYYTREPSAEAGGQMAVTLGDNDLKRYAGVYDFGTFFGNSRAYAGFVRLKSCRWAYGCADQSRIDETHGEIKFVTDFSDKLKLTGFVAYDDAIDDPIIEATRAFLDTTTSPDGSVPSLLPSRPHNGNDQNQNWAAAWGAKRENTFGYLKLNYQPTESLSLEVAPYYHKQKGMGFFDPPYQQIAVDQTVAGAFRRTQAGGIATGSTRYRAYYGILLNGRQRAVVPGVDYTDTDGTAVASSQCYATGTAYVSNGVASFAGLNNANCVALQTFRTSLYAHDRYGFTSKAKFDVANHSLEGGLWYEKLDRDFGRAWRQMVDVTTGSPAYYTDPQLIDFQQHFKTVEYKVYAQDKMTFGDLTVSAGVQAYSTSIKAVKDAWNAKGQPVGGLKTGYDEDSDLLFTLGAVYKVDTNLQVFGTYSQNYGAVGDWALEKTGTDAAKLKASVASNYELGLRYANTRFATGVTAYFSNYENAITFRTADFFDANAGQSGGINYTAGTSGSYINTGKGIESKGIEANLRFKATDSLTVSSGLTFNSSEYLETFTGGTANAGSDQIVQKGNEVAMTPKTIANLSLDYHKGPVTATLSANYQGETAGDAQNTKALYLPARTVVDLSTTYNLAKLEGVSVQLNVNNLFDENYIGGALDEFTKRYMRGAPRSVSATLRAKF
jgi:iron complex outermembrane recepter protein